MRFFVAKVNLTEQAKLGFTYLRPLQVAYESPKFMLPIRLGMVNAERAAGTVRLRADAQGPRRDDQLPHREAAVGHGSAGVSQGPRRVREVLQGDVHAAGREAKTGARVPRVRVGHEAGAIRAPPIRCRTTSCGSSACSGERRRGRSRRTSSSRGCTSATTTRISPRTSCSRRPADRANFQGRYVLRHAWTGDDSCGARAGLSAHACDSARKRKPQRLASLTGWNSPDIRKRRWASTQRPASRCGSRRWWERIVEELIAEALTYTWTRRTRRISSSRAVCGRRPAAWDRFVLEYRPVLYRAADALDRDGGAREIADSLYAELYGIRTAGRAAVAVPLFQGRSSLATWLRAVLAQRYVDRAARAAAARAAADRADDGRRLDSRPACRIPLSPPIRIGPVTSSSWRRRSAAPSARWRSKDRLRLAYYYVQELTLAETGRLLKEHEATVSRQLARTRRAIRADVERELRDDAGLTEAQIAECFASVAADPGPLDLQPLLAGAPGDREASPERSV